MNVRPLRDRIIVRRLKASRESADHHPVAPRKAAAGGHRRRSGKVKDDGKRVALDVKSGDLILFGKHAEINSMAMNTVMREDKVMASSKQQQRQQERSNTEFEFRIENSGDQEWQSRLCATSSRQAVLRSVNQQPTR
jgi:chaperonin GroES